MGASSSKTSQELQTEITNEALGRCESGGAINISRMSGVTVSPPESCPNPSFVFEQSATVDSSCAIRTLQQATVEAAQTLQSTAEAGLGFTVSKSEAETLIDLQNKSEQACEGEDAVNIIDWHDVTFETCELYVTQDATAYSKCIIDYTQNELSKVTTEMVSESSGMSLGWILGIIAGVIALIVGIIILIVVGKALSGGRGGKTKVEIKTVPTANTATKAAKANAAKAANAAAKTANAAATTASNAAKVANAAANTAENVQIGGDCDDNDSMPYVFLIVAAVLIVIAYMFSGPSSAISQSEINQYNQRLAEAQRIANIPTTNNINDGTNTQVSTMVPTIPNYPSNIYPSYDNYNDYSTIYSPVAPAYYPDYTGVSDFSEQSNPSIYSDFRSNTNTPVQLDEYYRGLI